MDQQVTEKDLFYGSFWQRSWFELECGDSIQSTTLPNRESKFLEPHLQDEDLARQLVELGYRGAKDSLKRDEFEAKKREIEATVSPDIFEI